MPLPHFREAKCGPNPLECQFAGLKTQMPRLRARSACFLQGFLDLRFVFFRKNDDSHEDRLLRCRFFRGKITRRGYFCAYEVAHKEPPDDAEAPEETQNDAPVDDPPPGLGECPYPPNQQD